MLYKFRKLEGQGIRTTMNYNMTSGLEDMRTEYYKLKKQRKQKIQLSFKRGAYGCCQQVLGTVITNFHLSILN